MLRITKRVFGVVDRLNALDDEMLTAMRRRRVRHVVDPELAGRWAQLTPDERGELQDAAVRCEVADVAWRARWLQELQRVGSARRSHRMWRARAVGYALAPFILLAFRSGGVPLLAAAGPAVVWVLLVREFVRSRWVPAAAASSVSNEVVASQQAPGARRLDLPPTARYDAFEHEVQMLPVRRQARERSLRVA